MVISENDMYGTVHPSCATIYFEWTKMKQDKKCNAYMYNASINQDDDGKELVCGRTSPLKIS